MANETNRQRELEEDGRRQEAEAKQARTTTNGQGTEIVDWEARFKKLAIMLSAQEKENKEIKEKYTNLLQELSHSEGSTDSNEMPDLEGTDSEGSEGMNDSRSPDPRDTARETEKEAATNRRREARRGYTDAGEAEREKKKRRSKTKKGFDARSTPLSEKLESQVIPITLKIPKARSYEGKSDPIRHLTHIKQVMLTINIPDRIWDKCHCRCLGISLSGAAADWYEALPHQSIHSFAQLTKAFIARFSMYKKPKKKSSDLYNIVQEKGEPLAKYIERFNAARAVIPSCLEEVAIEAFRKGLIEDSRLYRELVRAPDLSFEQVMEEAEKERRWEDDVNRREKVVERRGRSDAKPVKDRV